MTMIQNGHFSEVERSRIDVALKEQEFGAGGVVDPSSAARLGKVLGADAVMLTNIVSSKNNPFFNDPKQRETELNVRIVSSSTAEVLFRGRGQGSSFQRRARSVAVGLRNVGRRHSAQRRKLMKKSKVKSQRSKVVLVITTLLAAVVLALSGCAPSATVNTQANATPVTQPNTVPIENPSVRNPEPAPVLPIVPPVAQPGMVVEPITDKNGDRKGDVDWGAGMIHATGKSVVDKTNANTAQAILMAERGAVVDAQRNLLEITQGVRVNGETVVKDFITASDIVFPRGRPCQRRAPDWRSEV